MDTVFRRTLSTFARTRVRISGGGSQLSLITRKFGARNQHKFAAPSIPDGPIARLRPVKFRRASLLHFRSSRRSPPYQSPLRSYDGSVAGFTIADTRRFTGIKIPWVVRRGRQGGRKTHSPPPRMSDTLSVS